MLKGKLVLTAIVAAVLLWGHSAIAQDASPIEPQAPYTILPASYEVAAQRAGVTTGLLAGAEPNADVFSVKSIGVKEPIVINLGWMPARPGVAYHTRYRLRGPSLEADASVYLMVREHKAKGTRPIQPYHKTSVRHRTLSAAQAADWSDRWLSFTTGPDTHALSASLVIAELKGELHVSAFELFTEAQYEQHAQAAAARQRAQAQAEYDQLMAEIRAQADARQPLVPRTLVFSRSQMKYGLERNYYHQWVDRPLLVNRAYRVPHKYVTPFPSYQRILEEVAKYDIDGLAFFPETKGRMGMFELHQQAGVEGVGLLPEFLPAISENHLDVKTEILKRALASPYTPRVNGKVLITSYGAQSLSPAEWDQILTELRKRVGDTFVFLPSLTNVVALRGPFAAGEPISRATIEKEKAFLRSYLDVCDGIYFNYPAAFRNKDRTFDEAFYRDIFIPIFKSVLSEPAYHGKYLGLSAYKSHMNPDRGNSLHEDYTRTLRRSFEAAMDARPDVIILPEWDEFNENTCFRPTVYGSTTTERILRYYMSRIKGVDPTPVPGDDTTIPNLILSTRKAVTLGEELIVELLNVPDSAGPSTYTAELTLLDAQGRVVHTFEPVTFDAAELQEHRFSLPTETIPDVRAVVPVLTVRGYKGRDLVYDTGFHHVQIRATWNWDHLAVKQPLRDLLRPASVEFAWETPAGDDGPLVLTGSVVSPEDLALVEVLGDDDEVYAVDPTDEFFRNDPDRELLLIEYRSQHNLEMAGSLTLKNATAKWLLNGTPLHQPEAEADVKADHIELKTPVSVHPRWLYLAIPRSDLDAAELVFDFDKAKFTVPVREVFERKMIARGLEDGLHITIYPYRRQIDMPVHLNKKEVSFRVKIWPEIATEQYHLRLTTVEGKTFRSRPLLLPNAGGPSTTLRVYSDRAHRGVDVRVAADRVPELAYDFDPERGAALLTDAGRPFWATLGGFASTTTGRGTIDDLFHGKYPDSIERSAPQWVEDDGRPALTFDGVGTYLVLPREALPWRGAFTLSFEVKPTASGDQCLLVNGTTARQNGLALDLRGGELVASFRDRDWVTHRFATGLAVPANTWSSIKVRYDFETLTLAVNGQEATFPLTLPASNIGFTVVGGGWTGNWFTGLVRDLRIVHNVE